MWRYTVSMDVPLLVCEVAKAAKAEIRGLAALRRWAGGTTRDGDTGASGASALADSRLPTCRLPSRAVEHGPHEAVPSGVV
jgi:hypothetical protein